MMATGRLGHSYAPKLPARGMEGGHPYAVGYGRSQRRGTSL